MELKAIDGDSIESTKITYEQSQRKPSYILYLIPNYSYQGHGVCPQGCDPWRKSSSGGFGPALAALIGPPGTAFCLVSAQVS